MSDMFSHIQTIRYAIQIGNTSVDYVGIFNCNKLSTDTAIKCVQTDTHNKYLLTMTLEQFEAVFLDDATIVEDEEEPT